MRTTKFSTAFFILIICILSSCKKSDSPSDTTTTVVEDKQNITATFNNTMNCVTQVKDGEFFQSIVGFLNLQNGEVIDEDWIDNIAESLDDVANLQWIDENERFSMDYFKGVYTWNSMTEEWTKSSSSQIIVNFPSDRMQTSNNCSLKINEYSDKDFIVDGETVYLPTTIKANLTKNSNEILNLNMSCIYNSSGYPVPIDATISLKLDPFSYSFIIKRLTNTQFEVTADIFSGSECSTKLYSKVSLAHNDYENLDPDEDVNNIEFEYKKGDIGIVGTWDVKTYSELSDPTTDQLNSTLNFIVNSKQQKIGDLRFKDVGDQTKLFIYYKDGTSENTSIYYDPFYSDFKSLCQPYFGDLDKKSSIRNIYKQMKVRYLKNKISGWFN